MPSSGCLAAGVVVPLLLGGLAVSLITAVLADTAPQQAAPGSVEGIPDTLLDAYVRAPEALEEEFPSCTGMRWQILAGIGSVESDLLAGHDISPVGDVDPPMIGPRLDGSGVGGNLTPHYDTDGGKWDGDTTYDRAVGPNQHLPSGWSEYGADGNNDGTADPHNVYDSALGSARQLCITGGATVNFTDRAQLSDALFRYNPADWYVSQVLEEIDRFDALSPLDTGKGAGFGAGAEAAQWALAQLGKPYVFGANGPDAFDCSSLTQQAWAAAGVGIPRVTTDQYQAGQHIPADQLQPGDLLFYDTSDLGAPGAPPTHVTMYIGDGQMVNAPSSGQSVRTEPVEGGDVYPPRFMGAVRPIR
ncbi:C40 family peptidase [Nocardiopsis coralliicola]